MNKRKKLLYIVNILLGVIFLASGINRIYVKPNVNTFFIFFGIFVIGLNLYFLYTEIRES